MLYSCVGWAALMQSRLADAEPCLLRAYELALENGQAAVAVVRALQIAHMRALRGEADASSHWSHRASVEVGLGLLDLASPQRLYMPTVSLPRLESAVRAVRLGLPLKDTSTKEPPYFGTEITCECC